MTSRTLATIGASLLLAYASVTPADAGLIGDCREPALIRDAAVNTVVLGYRYTGQTNVTLEGAAASLAPLIQFDTLFSQLKYRSIAVVQLTRPAENDFSLEERCAPDAIVERLSAQLKPGNALIFLWGNLFEDEGSLFIQSFIEIRHAGGDFALNWRLGDRSYAFTAGLPIDRAPFAAREIPRAEVERLSDVYKNLAVARDQPSNDASPKPLVNDPHSPLSFYIDDVRHDWMHLKSFDGREVGWIDAGRMGHEWPLRKFLPELDLVEGAVGYLLLQIDHLEGRPFEKRIAEHADSELARFGESADRERSASTLALAKSMQGIITALRGGVRETMPELQRVFQEVVQLVPASSQARNLKALVDLNACCMGAPKDVGAQDVIDQLTDALRVEPRDERTLSNMENLYLALGSYSGPNAPNLTRAELMDRAAQMGRVRAALKQRR